MHSGHYTKGKDYEGKKVVVVGACTSGKLLSVWRDMFSFLSKMIGHDIAKDLYDHGVSASIVPFLFPAPGHRLLQM